MSTDSLKLAPGTPGIPGVPGKQLDRNLALQRLLIPDVDTAHGAAPELLDDDHVAEFAADYRVLVQIQRLCHSSHTRN